MINWPKNGKEAKEIMDEIEILNRRAFEAWKESLLEGGGHGR